MLEELQIANSFQNLSYYQGYCYFQEYGETSSLLKGLHPDGEEPSYLIAWKWFFLFLTVFDDIFRKWFYWVQLRGKEVLDWLWTLTPTWFTTVSTTKSRLSTVSSDWHRAGIARHRLTWDRFLTIQRQILQRRAIEIADRFSTVTLEIPDEQVHWQRDRSATFIDDNMAGLQNFQNFRQRLLLSRLAVPFDGNTSHRIDRSGRLNLSCPQSDELRLV